MAVPLCVLCGKRAAGYVCQDCGKAVCSNCFDPAHWSCSECQTKIRPAAPVTHEAHPIFSMATWLFFIALAVIFIGMMLMALGSISNLKGVSGGAVILIGPIPIFLGSGPYSTALIALAAVLTILALLFFLALRRRIPP